jgi:transcriptional regulator with XRE-family HTH domain
VLRTERNMSAKDLAKRAGVSATYLYWLERRGTVPERTATLVRFATALNVPTDTLLGYLPLPTPPVRPLDTLDRQLIDKLQQAAEGIIGANFMRAHNITWRTLVQLQFSGFLRGLLDRDHRDDTRKVKHIVDDLTRELEKWQAGGLPSSGEIVFDAPPQPVTATVRSPQRRVISAGKGAP